MAATVKTIELPRPLDHQLPVLQNSARFKVVPVPTVRLLITVRLNSSSSSALVITSTLNSLENALADPFDGETQPLFT